MALSADDLDAVIKGVGETADGDLAAAAPQINTWYTWDTLYPGFGLERLYVDRELTKVAYGKAWQQIDATTNMGQSLHFSSRAKTLERRLEHIEKEIADRLAQAQASVAAVSTGVMTTTAPASPPYPAPYPDANDARYGGSPYITPPNPQGTGWGG